MSSATMIRRALGACGLALALATSQLALAAGLELKTEAFKEVEQVGKDGKKSKKREPLVRATPGTEVIYVLTYHNAGAQPAGDVKLDNPIPKGLVYQSGSAQGEGTVAEVSVDGGAHYGALDKLTVKGADGQVRPARAEDVTHVRWTLTAPLKPAAQGTVTYRAMLP